MFNSYIMALDLLMCAALDLFSGDFPAIRTYLLKYILVDYSIGII